MITIEEKALEYAKQKEGSIVVKTISTSGGWCEMPIKSLWIEVLKDFKPTKNFDSYEYEGIKVFIEKGLKLEEDILIYRKLKLPFVGTVLGSKGISVKYI